MTGTRDMQRALQDPRRKPFRPQEESEAASDDVSAMLLCYHDVKERSSPRIDVPVVNIDGFLSRVKTKK